MSVTVLFLVVFEAESTLPEFEKIETFLIYECVLLVIELLFFLFRTSRPAFTTDPAESVSDRYNRMTRIDVCASLISLLLYVVQISWLIYGNFIYFNLPTDLPIIMEEAEVARQYSPEEINSERWLYVALMTVLTVGYLHLMIFSALVFIFFIYAIGRCFIRQ